MRIRLGRQPLLLSFILVTALLAGACTGNTSTTTTSSPRAGLTTTSDATGSTDKPTTTTTQRIRVCGGDTLPPVDEAGGNPDFKRFRDQMLAAIAKKDVTFLKQHIDDDIRGSFGSEGNGIDSFLEVWGLTDNPQDSEFWSELSDVLRLGGSFTDLQKTVFTAPYVYSRWPEKYDAFTYAAIIGSSVNLRAAPNANASVICRLRYNIVQLSQLSTGESDWREVETTSGESGYVLGKYVRSSIDYRAQFKKEGALWKLVFFVAGD